MDPNLTPEVSPESPSRVDLDGPLDDGILFDQFSRYASCAQHLDASMAVGASVLDVGCGPFRLLGQFLPSVDVTYLDPLLPADMGEQVLSGSLDRLSASSRRWDWVIAVDTLEHVAPSERVEFVRSLMALAREGVVLSGPYLEDQAAVEVDARVNEVYTRKTGARYSWIEEHIDFGLPSLRETRAALEGGGFQCAVAGNGHAPWLDEFLPLTIVHLDSPEHVDTLRALSEHFNRELYEYDSLEPVYRRVLVGKKSEVPQLAEVLQPTPLVREEAARRWREFQGACQAQLSAHADELVLRALRAEQECRRAECEQGRRAKESEATLAKARLAERNSRELVARYEASISWKLTWPLRWAKQMARPLALRTQELIKGPAESAGRAVYRALPMSGEARFRAKRAFFKGFGWWMGGTAAHRNFVAEDRIRRDREAGRMLGGAGLALPAAKPGVADVIVWAVIDWHFRIQRPQHLARELARAGHRVFFVSPRIQRADQPGFSVSRLDEELALYSVELLGPKTPSIYAGVPTDEEHQALAESVRGVLRWMGATETWSILEHPGWLELACMPANRRLVYDWMDEHLGFDNTARSLSVAESDLQARADLVIVSSEALRRKAVKQARSICMLRNAGEFEHFHHRPAEVVDVAQGRQVIGYYGAIAEWFDVDLVRELARSLPEALVLLIGADTANVSAQLRDEPNVSFVGEVAYEVLPGYLHAMDVCVIPFQINELTLATNPVKVYEFLSAGLPVVTTDLPEIRDAGLDSLVERCADKQSFLEAVAASLAEPADSPRRAERIDRARQETWSERGGTMRQAIAEVRDPLVSVIVVTWNNLDLTKACLESLFADSASPELEVIVVDNGSTDGTPAWLRAEAARESRLQLILNEDNRGFAAANNQGLELATGEYLVLLNNDTVVTCGWLRGMVSHFRRDTDLGMLGPITNNIGNEAKVPTNYTSREEMHAEAQKLVIDGAGRSFEIEVVAFFCVMMTRPVYEEVGTLDEGFGMGFFEDDDYCRRVRATGKGIRCAEDVFIHHELSASFDKVDNKKRTELFERNKRYYESKWGEWQPHAYRKPQAHEPKSEPVSTPIS